MKYKDRDNLVADLRELADLLEEKGLELPFESWYPFRVVQRFYGNEAKPTLIRAAKALRNANKQYGFSDFELVRSMMNGMVELVYETNRENVCERKLVDVKKVPKKIYVEVPGEFEDEPVYEWDCTEALLKG